MSPDVDDLYRALDEIDARGLPFQLEAASMEDGWIEVHTATVDVGRAQAYFAEHPFELRDGTRVPVEVRGGVGSWAFLPSDTWDGEPGPLSPDQLVGLEMGTAASVATAAGWRVRAFEPEAPLTADLVTHRLNLRCSPGGTVTEAFVG